MLYLASFTVLRFGPSFQQARIHSDVSSIIPKPVEIVEGEAFGGDVVAGAERGHGGVDGVPVFRNGHGVAAG